VAGTGATAAVGSGVPGAAEATVPLLEAGVTDAAGLLLAGGAAGVDCVRDGLALDAEHPATRIANAQARMVPAGHERWEPGPPARRSDLAVSNPGTDRRASGST
jgi:hypothetical protein